MFILSDKALNIFPSEDTHFSISYGQSNRPKIVDRDVEKHREKVKIQTQPSNSLSVHDTGAFHCKIFQVNL